MQKSLGLYLVYMSHIGKNKIGASIKKSVYTLVTWAYQLWSTRCRPVIIFKNQLAKILEIFDKPVLWDWWITSGDLIFLRIDPISRADPTRTKISNPFFRTLAERRLTPQTRWIYLLHTVLFLYKTQKYFLNMFVIMFFLVWLVEFRGI